MSTEAAAAPEQAPTEIRLNRDGSTPKRVGRPPGSGRKTAGKAVRQPVVAVPLLDETKAAIDAAVKAAREKFETAQAELVVAVAYQEALSEENLAKERARLDQAGLEAELASAA